MKFYLALIFSILFSFTTFASSPLLWGPNNTSNNLQNKIKLATNSVLGLGLDNWTASTAYISGDLVLYGGNTYTALSSHTSGSSFETDIQSGRWRLTNTPLIQENLAVVGNNFEDNDVGGWTAISLASGTNGLPVTVGTAGLALSSTNGGTTKPANLANPVTTSTSPINGIYSLNFASTGTFAAYAGYISQIYNIPTKYQAKVLTAEVSFKVISGTFNMSGTNANSMALAIYDPINNSWLSGAGIFSFTQLTGVGAASITFQTAYNTTGLQLYIYSPNSPTGTASILIDDVFIGKQASAVGLTGPVGEIIATGGTIPPTGFLYCDGTAVSRSQYADLFKAIGTTYGTGDGSTTFNLPNLKGVFPRGAGSQTIGAITYTGTLGATQADAIQGHYHDKNDPGHTHLIGSNSTTFGAAGTAEWTLAGGAKYNTSSNTTGLTVLGPTTDGSNGTPRTSSETRPANVVVGYHIRYLASYVMSSDAATNVVATSVRRASTGQTVGTAATKVQWNAITFDKTGSFDATTNYRYTIPVSGQYKFSGSILLSSAASFTAYSIYLYKNGSALKTVWGIGSATVNSGSAFSFLVDTIAGDYFEIYVATTGASTSLISDATIFGGSYWDIERISGPSQIASTETVSALYTGAPPTGTLTNSYNIVTFGTKVKDSHSAYSGGTYTVPVSGVYSISASINNTATYALNNSVIVAIYIDGTIAYRKAVNAFGTTTNGVNPQVNVNSIPLLSGQAVTIRAYNDATSPAWASSNENWFSITRTGNY